MPEFPILPAGLDGPLPHMSLRDYAHFSERCLRGNPAVTTESCPGLRADELTITAPFRLVDPAPRPAGRRRP